MAGFILPKKLDKFQAQGGKIYLYHSKNDKVVSFANCKEYKNELPEAEMVTFRSRGHFDQAAFPELIANIKKLSNSLF